MSNTNNFDEQLIWLFKKIEIPKNPLSFYLNITQIENNLSDWLRDYFYKAVNEFISPTKVNVEWTFLDKLYYYSSFFENITIDISWLLDILKHYDLWSYVYNMNLFDKKIRFKCIAFMKNRPDLINFIDTSDYDELVSKELFQFYKNQTNEQIFSEFEKYFYNLNESKDSHTIKYIYNSISININKYPISYKKLQLSFDEFQKTDNYSFYRSINFCFSYIVSNYDRNLWSQENLINKILDKIEDKKKYYFISKIIRTENNNFVVWKKLHKEKDKIFKSEKEFIKFLITYLINKRFVWLKKIFYWEAIKTVLSEDEWAKIWWINLFYLQKIDNNIGNFNLLLFSKQFKDSIIESYNSISWTFIKPYFFYILVFKSVKLPLKGWQKLFFLLMFFSAENYGEYIILQDIMNSIKKVWLWNFSKHYVKFFYYIKRLFILLSQFYSSIILSILLLMWLWFFWLINILMLWIIFLFLILSWLKYIFFPGKFEIFRTISIVIFVILSYTWFTVVFPKISQPQYVSYVWKEIQSLVSLNFSGTKENYKNMISYIYWKNYKKFEKKLLTTMWYKIANIADNKQVKQLVLSTKQITTSIIKNYNTQWIRLKKWTYLKYYIDQEIKKSPIPIKKRQILSKKVIKDYILWYCSIKHDIYCRTRLEKLPVWFKISLTKIKQLIEKDY